jgi:hypothetical protein
MDWLARPLSPSRFRLHALLIRVTSTVSGEKTRYFALVSSASLGKRKTRCPSLPFRDCAGPGVQGHMVMSNMARLVDQHASGVVSTGCRRGVQKKAKKKKKRKEKKRPWTIKPRPEGRFPTRTGKQVWSAASPTGWLANRDGAWNGRRRTRHVFPFSPLSAKLCSAFVFDTGLDGGVDHVVRT